MSRHAFNFGCYTRCVFARLYKNGPLKLKCQCIHGSWGWLLIWALMICGRSSVLYLSLRRLSHWAHCVLHSSQPFSHFSVERVPLYLSGTNGGPTIVLWNIPGFVGGVVGIWLISESFFSFLVTFWLPCLVIVYTKNPGSRHRAHSCLYCRKQCCVASHYLTMISIIHL